MDNNRNLGSSIAKAFPSLKKRYIITKDEAKGFAGNRAAGIAPLLPSLAAGLSILESASICFRDTQHREFTDICGFLKVKDRSSNNAYKMAERKAAK